MGRFISNDQSATNIVTSVPIGGYADVFSAGEDYAPVGTVLERALYPELSDKFPVNKTFGGSIQTTYPQTILQPNRVAFGNSKFVAVGGEGGTTYNVAAVSSDGGMTWASRTLPDTIYWNSVCCGDGLFVAVAQGSGGIATTNAAISRDGDTWQAITMPNSAMWSSVCYGEGLFVAVAGKDLNSAVAATSPDGINWTSRTLPSSSWSSVCYGNGLFVAVSGTYTGSTIAATSPDGINWTQRALPQTKYWSSVCYGNGLFVAVAGTTGQIATSPDGINWTMRVEDLTYGLNQIIYGNGIFVALNGLGGGDNATVRTSLDGINWTPFLIMNFNHKCGAYGDGVFLLAGGQTNVNRLIFSNGNIYLTGTTGKYVRVR